MGEIRSFMDLNAWKEGHKLVLIIYRLTKKFPKDELFGLNIQIRRAVVSVTSNVAEGFARQYKAEKIQFYAMANGSLSEVQNQLIIAKDVNYIAEKEFKEAFEQSIIVQKLINGLIRSIKNFS